ncbi:MAG: hypothetical protein FJ098_04405 [Deltaproteobacteria bacterium]|nr:hypothetical protein [Deltaproteobacteria bacterium]
MAKARCTDIEGRVGPIDDAIRREHGRQAPGELVIEARRILEEEYDYERAWDLLRLAAVRGEGRWDAVEPLARFVVEDYAQLEAALSLLDCAAWAEVPEARRLLAQALFHLERHGEALALYEEVAPLLGNATMYLRIGTIHQELDHHDRAVEAFRRALELDPGLAAAAERRGRSEEVVLARVRPMLEAAAAALDAGRHPEAAEALAGLSGFAWLPPEAQRLRRRLEEARRLGALEELLLRGAAQEDAGDREAARELFSEALSLDPSCALARERLAHLDRLDAGDRARSQAAEGDRLFAAGRPARAAEAWYRALAEAARHAAEPPAAAQDAEAAPLFALLASFANETGRFVGEAQAEALVALRAAAETLARGDPEEALRLHRGIRGLEGFSVHRDVGESATARVRERGRAAADRLAAEAFAAAEAGDLVLALERARQALAGGRDDLSGLVEGLEARQREEQARAALLGTARRLHEAGAHFELLRHLRASPDLADAAPETRAWGEAAREAIAQRFPFPLRKTEASLEPALHFSSADAGIPELSPGETWVLPSPTRDAAFLLQGDRLSMVDLRDYHLAWSAPLPPEARPRGEGVMFLASRLPDGEDLFACLDRGRDHLALFTHFRGRLEMMNLLPCSRFLRDSREKLLLNATLDGPERTLLVLETSQDRPGPTRITGISLDDGRILFENEHSFGLFHLARLPWRDGAFRVNRVFDPRGLRRPGFFTWALLDGRGRLTERFLVPPEQVEGAWLEGITSLQESPSSGRRFLFSRFIEPYTGQVVRHPPAFAVLEADGSVWYAVLDAAAILREKGDVLGSLHLAITGEGERLVVPFKRKARHVIGVFDPAELTPLRHVELDPGVEAAGVFSNRERTRLWVYFVSDGGRNFSIRGLEP